jgi:hypothetical protein
MDLSGKISLPSETNGIRLMLPLQKESHATSAATPSPERNGGSGAFFRRDCITKLAGTRRVVAANES